MRISSGFLDAKRKEEDRIDKKRRENREAFEAYRKMRIENGDEVSVADFQQMRQSLSGGDAFLLQDLGPGSMLSEMAKRTNQQSLNTRVAEDAKFAENRKKTQDLFNTFVMDNLNLDPTDMIGNKQKFMALFPEAKELGEEIWARNSGKFAEAILDGRQKGAQEFHDLFLQNVHTMEEAEAIMNANGVKPWKKNAITSIMKQKQSKFVSDTTTEALKLVDNFSTVTSNLRHFSDAQIEVEVDGILARAKVNKTLMGDEQYKKLKASVKAQLEAKISHSKTEYTTQMEKEFNALVRGQGGEQFFKHGKDGRGFNSKETLDLYNDLRREKGLPEVEATDSQYLSHMASIGIRYNSSYKANYEEAEKKATTKVDAIVKQYKQELLGRGSMFQDGTSAQLAFRSMINSGMVLRPTVDAITLTQNIIKYFPNSKTKGSYSAEEENSIRAVLSNYMMPESEFREAVMSDQMSKSGLGFKPQTDFMTQIDEDKKDYIKTMEDYIKDQLIKFTVNVDIDDPRFDAFINNLDAEFDNYIDATVNVYMKSLGAFDVFPDSGSTIEKEVANLKAEMVKTKEDIMTEVRSGERRGSMLPKGSYVLPRGNLWRQGYKLMTVDLKKKIASDNAPTGYTEVAVTDKNGSPVLEGDLIRVGADGTIEKYDPGSAGNAPVLTQIATDPKKVGTDLMQSPNMRSFGGYTSGIVGGSDKDTAENHIADILYQMYSDMKSNGNLPNNSNGQQIDNPADFAILVLGGQPNVGPSGTAGGIRPNSRATSIILMMRRNIDGRFNP